ncbi:TetR family transcriptional regulator [Glutamicibacter sp. NPDC087344]|uniref:TetR/AcrR family transcriptional regulator n=1 Tax=Glutamicibacter sp. NPDC087344 TaxID=3363994 RepID=UPI00382B2C74
MSTAWQDLTGRARLRDAAIEAFAAQGFEESLRSIAARAQVTAGLVRHHFGSKDALRAECDATVLERYRQLKEESLQADPHQLFTHLPASAQGGVLLLYILRSAREGSAAGRKFTEQLIDEALILLNQSVSRGLIVPSRDEPARARLLILQSLGALVLHFALNPPQDPEDFAAVMQDYYSRVALPTLEIYSEGLFTDSAYLNEYLLATAADVPPATDAGITESR